MRLLLKRFLVITLNISLLSSPSVYANHPSEYADYVIVGVGTAGAVLAKMLTDDKTTSVIALHSGANLNNDPAIKYSRNALYTVLDGLVGFPFYETGDSVPPSHSLQWDIALPLGGASAINAGAYVRGTNQGYAQWEAIAGPLWSLDRINNIFVELENYDGLTPDPAARGYFGPLNVYQIPNPSIGSQKFTQAIINATQLPFVQDFNDPNTPVGASSQLQYTTKGRNGSLRVSSGVAFLNRTVMNQNGYGVNHRRLRVLFNSTALNIIWNGNTAIGVKYMRGGKVKEVFAKKGVIVSAGLRSSTFLLHSGIGPKKVLESLQIPVIYDNPNVGQGLIDQPLIVLTFASNPNDSISFKSSSPPSNIARYFNQAENTDIGKSFLNTSLPLNLNRLATPNGVFQQIAFLPYPNMAGNRAFIFATTNPIPGFTFAVFNIISPQTRGVISIDSSNPLSPPVIDFGNMTSDDIALYVSGFQKYISAINTSLRSIDPSYYLIDPNPANINNTEWLTAFIKENAISNQCFQGHVRMAPLEQGGVVDGTGHVYGVKNLIVADNSINPIPMDGTPMASGYLVAVNIAKILLGV